MPCSESMRHSVILWMGFASLTSAQAVVDCLDPRVCTWLPTGMKWPLRPRYENETFGYAVSLAPDGKTVAIAVEPRAGGIVRIYAKKGESWSQLGGAIDVLGLKVGGNSVSFSTDGRTVALGGMKLTTERISSSSVSYAHHGVIQVYTFDAANKDWSQLGKDMMVELGRNLTFEELHLPEQGLSVSLSAGGETVAMAVPRELLTSTYHIGKVRVYAFDGVAWSQLGQEMDGDADSYRSGSVMLSADGKTVAVGAFTDQNSLVQVYALAKINNISAWSQLGQNIDGEFAGNNTSGKSVAFSADGKTLAIGNPMYKEESGHVRIHAFDGTSWSQLGQDIDGEARGDQSGTCVSLSADGKMVAVGAPLSDGGSRSLGHVRVHAFDGTRWSQVGQDIDGDYQSQLGDAVSLSADGKTVAIGAPWGLYEDGNYYGSYGGYVRVFELHDNPPLRTVSPTISNYTGREDSTPLSMGLISAGFFLLFVCLVAWFCRSRLRNVPGFYHSADSTKQYPTTNAITTHPVIDSTKQYPTTNAITTHPVIDYALADIPVAKPADILVADTA